MDFREIKELIRVFDKSELNKLKVKDADFEIALQKGFDGAVTVSAPVAAPVALAAAPVAAPVSDSASSDTAAAVVCGETINSPMVGTYYASPSPEAGAFVKAGDMVKTGQTLCILEAMKIMNEVEAEYDFKVIEVLVKDGSPVEYDMPLFLIEKI
ncbi:acetyl-CoA carboxylase, biotin carboxyl carrier protein [Arcobacter sp. 31_11_sub10_T18]|nr:acetyl-CoA carboxylase, biotin carboxyl carrier protein [Arcobacter sp. 31_11_sub10_T18]